MLSALNKPFIRWMYDDLWLKRAGVQKRQEIYRRAKGNDLMEKMSKLNRFNRKNVDFIRRFTAGVKTVEMDTAGRLNVPKDLALFAGISKDVVLSSAINIVELWDKEAYEKAINDAANDFADLAEDVMGDTTAADGVS